MEMPRLGVLFKHDAQCKGHSKGGDVPLRLGIIQVRVHNHHEVNLYYEDVFQIWTVHGRSKTGSNLATRLHEGAYILLCVHFH